MQSLNLIKFEPECQISAGSLSVEGPKWLLRTWLLGKHLLVVRGWAETMGTTWGSSTLSCFIRIQKCSQAAEEALEADPRAVHLLAASLLFHIP